MGCCVSNVPVITNAKKLLTQGNEPTSSAVDSYYSNSIQSDRPNVSINGLEDEFSRLQVEYSPQDAPQNASSLGIAMHFQEEQSNNQEKQWNIMIEAGSDRIESDVQQITGGDHPIPNNDITARHDNSYIAANSDCRQQRQQQPVADFAQDEAQLTQTPLDNFADDKPSISNSCSIGSEAVQRKLSADLAVCEDIEEAQSTEALIIAWKEIEIRKEELTHKERALEEREQELLRAVGINEMVQRRQDSKCKHLEESIATREAAINNHEEVIMGKLIQIQLPGTCLRNKEQELNERDRQKQFVENYYPHATTLSIQSHGELELGNTTTKFFQGVKQSEESGTSLTGTLQDNNQNLAECHEASRAAWTETENKPQSSNLLDLHTTPRVELESSSVPGSVWCSVELFHRDCGSQGHQLEQAGMPTTPQGQPTRISHSLEIQRDGGQTAETTALQTQTRLSSSNAATCNNTKQGMDDKQSNNTKQGMDDEQNYNTKQGMDEVQTNNTTQGMDEERSNNTKMGMDEERSNNTKQGMDEEQSDNTKQGMDEERSNETKEAMEEQQSNHTKEGMDEKDSNNTKEGLEEEQSRLSVSGETHQAVGRANMALEMKSLEDLFRLYSSFYVA